ncbi:hypothetical protein HYC85_016601 [Camellia sinensis]|uniref:non-specific serine/threonine protein kinase n=1 Tax=Camellia sinensis TaxID=4442 RepID=A0A7J7H023_CAMSI|nr:hypothetical protein HYC85_016601 [Camellia sinensis]
MMDQVKCEILIIKKVHHPNIVKLHEVMATKTKIYFAMEYLYGGEFFEKLACTVDFCHSRIVYYNDLKSENLLLDENGNLKVTYFRLSAFSENLKHDGLLHTAYGTLAYVAPEVIGKRGYDKAKIYRVAFKFPPWLLPKNQMIMNRLLDPNPITRISASELMDTTWFKFNNTIPKNRGIESEKEKEKEKKTLNAFHIISLSGGFDLSSLLLGKIYDFPQVN